MRRSVDCDRVRFQISLDLDGQLSELERAMVTAHLARCVACSAYRDDVAAATDRLRATPFEPLDSPVVLPRRRRVAVAQPLQAAAVAGALLVVVLGSAVALVESNRPSQPQLDIPTRPAYVDSVRHELSLFDSIQNKKRAFRAV
jgi:predicted anti-sigma-YlaC factor YlaD